MFQASRRATVAVRERNTVAVTPDETADRSQRLRSSDDLREPNPERAKGARKVDMKRTDNTQRRSRKHSSRVHSSQEQLPERVPFSVIPTGETPVIDGWAQRAVWTDRMLTTLCNNTVKGGRWHSLIDKVYSHTFHDRSYGFRHGRSCHDALGIVEQKLSEGYVYVVDADLKGYFRHARWPVFKDVDAMVRRRLRRLLKKRHRRNPQRLPATQRWPNAYFAETGLYSLREAHSRFAQSRAGPD